MIPDHVRERILVQLQNQLDVVTQQRHQGNSGYHFCHPKQLEYHRAKGVEIDEINDLMKIVEELE